MHTTVLYAYLPYYFANLPVVHTTVLYAYLPKGYMQIYHVDAHHSAICIFTIILCKFTIVMHTTMLYAYLPYYYANLP